MINSVLNKVSVKGMALGCLSGLLLSGCGQNDIQVYRVAKETAPAVHNASGWEEAPLGEMRVASFRVKGQGGQTADVSVIPLPGMAGHDLDNVNRWRGQVSLPPVSESELAGLGQPVELAG